MSKALYPQDQCRDTAPQNYAILKSAIRNGFAGIWYSYAVGHPVSARGGFLRWLPYKTRSPSSNQ